MKTNNIIKISMSYDKFQTLIGLLATLCSSMDRTEMTRDTAKQFLDDILTKNKINISHCINLEECFIHNDYNNDTLATMAVRQRQSEITKHLYDNYISDAVFLSECDSEGKCRVFFDDKELFSILADSCDIICELKHKEARDV